MKQFKIFTIFTFVLSAFVLTSCYKDDDKFSSPDEFIENPSVSSAIRESGVPVYQGGAPPELAGTYSVSGSYTDASYEMEDIIGERIQSVFVLSKQTKSGKIDVEERGYDGTKVSGSGSYITGNNGHFTIYAESVQTGREAGLPNNVSLTVVLMMSGTKASNGNLVDVEGITIITKANNSEYKEAEGQWWLWEADFYLQAGVRSSSVLKSTTNSDGQLLLQKALKAIMETIEEK